MGKCVLCGKKGLFLSLNSEGLCEECVEKEKQRQIEEEEKKKNASREFFEEIADKLYKMPHRDELIHQLGKGYSNKQANLYKVDEAILNARKLISRLHDYEKYPYLLDVISQHLTPDKYMSINGAARIPEWNVLIWHSMNVPGHNQYVMSEIIDSVVRDVSKKIKEEYQTIPTEISRYLRFEETISAIPETATDNISLTNQDLHSIDISRIKLSQITAKDLYENLGNFSAISIDKKHIAVIKFIHWKPVNKSKFNICEESMISLSEYIGQDILISDDLLIIANRLNEIGCPLLSAKRKYYDVMALIRKMMESKAWQKENGYSGVYNITFETVCDFYNIYDIYAAPASEQAVYNCYAAAEIFKIVCKYRAS